MTYTFETLEQIHAERPSDELFFLMGADSVRDLPSWRKPQRICELATIIAVQRHGAPVPDVESLRPLVSPERFAAAPPVIVEMPLIDLSSTDIRESVGQGRSIRYRLPAAVEKYIETHGLYRVAS